MNKLWLAYFGISQLISVFNTHFQEGTESIQENFKKQNLIAWCVVNRWDAESRTPEEFSRLFFEMGIKRLAYNWQKEDQPDFEEVIIQCKKNNIELFAFWNEDQMAFKLFEKHNINPQIWKVCFSPSKGSQE
jgi:hypothetical protein